MTTQITKTEIRNAIKSFAESRPERQISFGEYIGTVGIKYVEIINCHDKTTTEKVPLDEFCEMVADGKTFIECYREYQEFNQY